MGDMAEITEPQRHFPNLWRNTESLVRVLLYRLEVDNSDAEVIIVDLMRRCAGLKAILPVDPNSQTHLNFAALMLDAIDAERRLFAAQHGRFPGEALGDWPPTPISFENPFLLELQSVVGQIEAEANAAEGGKKLN